MPEQENLKQWISDLFSSIDRKDTDKFCSFLADAVQFRFGNMPSVLGKSAVRQQLDYFFSSISSLSHTIEEYWLQEDAIVCHGSVTYTRLDNSTLSVPFANIFKMGPQLINDYLIFADVSALYSPQ